MTRRALGALLVLAALVSGATVARAQDAAALQRQADAAFARLVAGLVRTQGYLVYFDQINRIAVAGGQLSTADADQRLRQKGVELFNRDYADSEIAAIVQQHRGQVAAFLARIRQHVDGSGRWPGGAAGRCGAGLRPGRDGVRGGVRARVPQLPRR